MILKLTSFVSIAFITLVIIWGLGWVWFATTIALEKPSNDKAKTDAIIVLTGGTGRITEGLNLLNEGLAPKLLISGVNENVKIEDIYKRWTKSDSLRPCCITLGYKSTDTISNATEVKEWVTKNDIKSMRLITSSYHMPRAIMEIKKLLPDIIIIRHPVFSNDSKPGEDRFWMLSFSEYNKTLLRWMQNIK